MPTERVRPGSCQACVRGQGCQGRVSQAPCQLHAQVNCYRCCWVGVLIIWFLHLGVKIHDWVLGRYEKQAKHRGTTCDETHHHHLLVAMTGFFGFKSHHRGKEGTRKKKQGSMYERYTMAPLFVPHQNTCWLPSLHFIKGRGSRSPKRQKTYERKHTGLMHRVFFLDFICLCPCFGVNMPCSRVS